MRSIVTRWSDLGNITYLAAVMRAKHEGSGPTPLVPVARVAGTDEPEGARHLKVPNCQRNCDARNVTEVSRRYERCSHATRFDSVGCGSVHTRSAFHSTRPQHDANPKQILSASDAARIPRVQAHSRNGRDASRDLFRNLAALLLEFDRDRNAPVVGIVGHVGNYWRNWLLVTSRVGSLRPSAMRRLLGTLDPGHPLSQKMLTHNLRMLERDGMYTRTEVADARKHVEYALTPLGRELSDLIMTVIDWGFRHSDQIDEARASYDSASRGDTTAECGPGGHCS
nr:helix-turn-helix domain-containing protein [Rhodococcus sp. 06-418-1B]